MKCRTKRNVGDAGVHEDDTGCDMSRKGDGEAVTGRTGAMMNETSSTSGFVQAESVKVCCIPRREVAWCEGQARLR